MAREFLKPGLFSLRKVSPVFWVAFFFASTAHGLVASPAHPPIQKIEVRMPEPPVDAFHCGNGLARIAHGGSVYLDEDLEPLVGTESAFLTPLPRPGKEPAELGYFASVRNVADVPVFLQELAQELVRRSIDGDFPREYACLAATVGQTLLYLFYSSNSPDFIDANLNSRATSAFLSFLEKIPEFPRERDAGRLHIHRLHSHLDDGPSPPSARDILTELHTLEVLRERFRVRLQFQSHIVPLLYRGQILVSFDPQEHRVY